jgi:hypothetical protein
VDGTVEVSDRMREEIDMQTTDVVTYTPLTPDEFIEAMNRPGAWTRAAITTRRKARREFPGVILEKTTTCVVQTGLDYARAAAKYDRQAGSLRWGEWVPGLEKFVLRHTPKGTDEVRYYARVFIDWAFPVTSTCWVDGVEVSRDVYATYLPDAEGRKFVAGSGKEDNPTGCLSPLLGNVTIIKPL